MGTPMEQKKDEDLGSSLVMNGGLDISAWNIPWL